MDQSKPAIFATCFNCEADILQSERQTATFIGTADHDLWECAVCTATNDTNNFLEAVAWKVSRQQASQT